jgi:iron complex transport system ATP-binding protein
LGDPGRGRREVSIEAAGLSFAYPARGVLHDVSLRVDPGEIVGLIGPNGSGKTTLLRVLSGLESRYAGSVRLGGRELRALPARERASELALVAQETTVSAPFSVLEIVLLGRHPHLSGLAFEAEPDRLIALAALRRAGAEALASRNIQQLSSGERQRVLFAMALAQEPRALLLDEAGSFLDLRHQVELWDLVRELAQEDRVAVLAVLHDLNLAAEYCDRVALLQHGRIVAVGPTREVLTYANLTRVFETEVYVDLNDLTGALVVTPLSGRARQALLLSQQSVPR